MHSNCLARQTLIRLKSRATGIASGSHLQMCTRVFLSVSWVTCLSAQAVLCCKRMPDEPLAGPCRTSRPRQPLRRRSLRRLGPHAGGGARGDCQVPVVEGSWPGWARLRADQAHAHHLPRPAHLRPPAAGSAAVLTHIRARACRGGSTLTESNFYGSVLYELLHGPYVDACLLHTRATRARLAAGSLKAESIKESLQ